MVPNRKLAAALVAFLATSQLLATASRQVWTRVDGGRRLDAFRTLPLYQGARAEVGIEGPGVEKVTKVELGPGLDVPESSLQRAPGRLVFQVVTGPGAPLGAHDLRLRYAIELEGPERFPVVVLRNGHVRSVDPARVKVGQKVTLTFSGDSLGNADVLAAATYRDARIVPGGTESRCQVEITFTRPGSFEVPLYDKAGPPRPGPTIDAPGGYTRDAGARVEVVP